MSSGGKYNYGYYPANPSVAPQGSSAATGTGRAGYPSIASAGGYLPAGPAPYSRYRQNAPAGAPQTPSWQSHRPYPAPPPQAPPARPPDNMSSLTRYTLKVKDEFIFPPPVPAASIERVQPTSHELSTPLEDTILAEAEARLRAGSTPLPSGAATDSLLGDLSSVAINSSHTGAGGAVGTGGSTLAACAPPPMPPMVDAAQPALEVYSDMHIGSAVSRKFALAKYPAEDQETVEAFCRHFEKCKEVLHDKVTDRDIAAALYATDSDNGPWHQSAMDLLIA